MAINPVKNLSLKQLHGIVYQKKNTPLPSLTLRPFAGLAKHPQIPFIVRGTDKAGLTTFSKYFAKEFGPQRITANVVSPGLVDTDATRYQPEEFKQHMANLTPLGRIATPEIIARVIALYMSDDSQFMTGSVLSVDGVKIPGATLEVHRPGHIAVIRIGKNTLNLVNLKL